MAVFDFRRTKILILIVLLFALNSSYKTYGLKESDLIQFTKKSELGDEGLCIAFDEEVNSAIEWSYPIPEDEHDLPEIVSSYLPTVLSSTYGNNFEDDYQKNDWKMENWFIPTHTYNNYIPILDARWEDFRTYLSNDNETKMIENRLEIPRNASIGISIRSDSTTNILLCQGYNPKSYPCYTIVLGGNTKKEVYVTKYGIEKNVSEYKSNVPILLADEWKNLQLQLSEMGHIQLKDIVNNVTYANVVDSTPINTLYLLINSSSSALWKIHKNNFLFTNTSQAIPFGPPIDTTSSTICLAMYLMMCKSCSIFFYTIRNSSQEIVLEILPRNDSSTSENRWENIRFIIDNVTGDSEQLYVKTHSDAIDRFWTIDNVRTCGKNELKIRKLTKGHYNQTLRFDDPTFSCHFLKFPAWRPKKQVISSEEFPIIEVSANITSIDLSWKIAYQRPYLIKYKGFDICNEDTISKYKNKQRLKSNGWIIVKPKQTSVTIGNLVPYTHYELSLLDPIYENNKTVSTNTNYTEKPNKDELPAPLITPGINQTKIFLPQRKCNISYGPVIYELNLMQKLNPYPLIGGSSHVINNLEPYTNYTMFVKTARTINNLKNPTLTMVAYFNFSTKPDVAPQIEAEVFESSQKSMSFRYQLPNKTNGIPYLVNVAACNPIIRNNCTHKMENITRCNLWKNKYCVTIDNLMKKTSYTFKLSIKNKNTNAFGKDFIIKKDTVNAKPGAPTDVSYKVINCSDWSEYCNLNISWWHPYNQNGIISSFEIFLQHNEEVIMNNFLIKDKQYLPTYSHIIRYLPYAKTYNMTIRAVNIFDKSENTTITVKIDHIGQHIDQLPKLLGYNGNEVIFQIPKLDYRLNSSSIIVLVQKNESENTNIPEDITSLVKNGDLCLHNKSSWIAGIWKASSDGPVNKTIGTGLNLNPNKTDVRITDKLLVPNTEYCVNFIITTIYIGKNYTTMHYEKHIVLPESPNVDTSTESLSLGAKIVLILLIILVTTVTTFVIYRVRKYRREKRMRRGEHIYEAMSTDDYIDYNVVYNAIYDKLNHE